MLVENLELDVALDLGPIGDLEDDVLVIVENCAANCHDFHPDPGVLQRLAVS
jgi:hypothetical protein